MPIVIHGLNDCNLIPLMISIVGYYDKIPYFAQVKAQVILFRFSPIFISCLSFWRIDHVFTLNGIRNPTHSSKDGAAYIMRAPIRARAHPSVTSAVKVE